ncbi:MAG: TlpA disulfide reductase family protein [Myxococcota bacterium]
MAESAEQIPPPSRRVEMIAGGVFASVLAVALGLGVLDVVRNKADLAPISEGDPAPMFSLPTPDKTARLGLENLKGQVVLVDFWATWCGPCLRELPELSELHKELSPRGFTVLGVNREPEDPARVQQFLKDKPMPFPVVIDSEGVGERYRILSLPMGVLISRDGRVLRQFFGYTEPQVMRQAVLQALDG